MMVVGDIRGRITAPKRSKVVIAIPTAQGVARASALTSLAAAMQAITALGYSSRFLQLNGSDIVAARNYFASAVLADKDTSHLLFIDSDMEARSSAVTALFSADKAVVGAIYPKKQPGPPRFVVRPKPHAKMLGDLIEVLGIGMGLALIKTEVLSSFQSRGLLEPAEHTARAYGLPAFYRGFFDPFMTDGDMLSEDFAFCQRWTNDCGGEVWGLTTNQVAHVGDFAYRGVFRPEIDFKITAEIKK